MLNRIILAFLELFCFFLEKKITVSKNFLLLVLNA